MAGKKLTKLDQARSRRIFRSYEHFGMVLDATLDGYILADEQGSILDVNPAYCGLIGYSREELLSMNIKEIDEQISSEKMDGFIRNMIDQGGARFDTKHRAKDGTILDLEVSIVVVHEGGMPLVAAFVRDISERMHRTSSRELLLRTIRTMSSTMEQERVLRSSMTSALTLTGMQTAAVYLLEGEELALRATIPELPQDVPGHLVRARLGDHPHIRKAMTTERPVYVYDTTEAKLSKAEKAISDVRGLRSLLYLPLVVEGKNNGVMIVGTEGRPQEIRDEDIDTCATLANFMALSIENIRLIESHVRQSAEQEAEAKTLAESEKRYRNLVDLSPDAIVVYSKGVIVLANNAAVRLVAAESVDDLLGKPVMEFVDPDYKKMVLDRMAMLIKGKTVPLVDEKFMRLDGSSVDVEVTAMPIVHDGKPSVLVVVRDITDRKRSERSLRALNRALRVITECNKALVKATEEPELLLDICRLLVERGGYRLAWVGYAEHDEGKNVRPAARAGYDHGFVDNLNISWGGGQRGRGPTGQSLRTGKAVVVSDIATDERFTPWREAALASGYGSMVALPLRVGDRIFGNLSIYSSLPDAFNPEEETLLGELADDLAFGILSLRDRKEKVRVEEVIARSEMRYRTLTDSIIDAVVTIDDAGRITGWNSAAEQMFGYAEAEMIGRGMDPIMPEGYRIDHHSGVTRLKQGGSGGILGKTVEKEGVRRDGTTFPLELSLSQWTTPEGRFFTGVIRDISERVRSEKALAASEDRYKQFFEEDLTGDFISTAKGELILCNMAFARMFGFDSIEETLKADTVALYKNPEDRVKYLDLLRKHRRLDYYELEMRRADGSPIYVIENSIGEFNEEGELTRIRGYVFDDTKRHLLEEQMISSQKMESLGTLAGGIAHDLNNVLGPIMLGLEALRPGIKDEESRTLLDTMDTSVRRGAEILKQILTFARGEKGAQGLLQVKHIMREVIRLAKETFPRSIDIVAYVDKDVPPIVGDATQIHQMLLNFCVNARDAMPDGGELRVRLDRTDVDESVAMLHLEANVGRYVRISIEDTGVGMTKETYLRMYEPFFTTKEVGRGTGLGLATVSTIVRNHGGFIDAESSPGNGSTFRVYLPAASGKDTAAGDERRKAIPVGKGELILVVDDERSIRDVTRTILEDKNYRVVTARDGEEAVDMFTKRKDEFDLILTDLMMPRMDGPSLISALKGIDPDVRIIAMSGLTSDGKTAAVQGEEVMAFLRKPFSSDSLLRAIADALPAPA